MTGGARTDAGILEVVGRWAGGAVELSEVWAWPHGEARVLAVRTPRGDVVVKRTRRRSTFEQELAALRTCVPALGDDSSQLLHADDEQGVLVLSMVPGALAEGTAAELDPDVHRQAGALVARLHRSAPAVVDPVWGAHLLARFDEWAGRGAGIVADDELRAARALTAQAVDLGPVLLVPAHRDNSPRNWLVHEGRVRLIDFGQCRAAPWVEDLHRMLDRQWLDRPDLRAAFLDGYGAQPSAHDLAVLAAHDVVAAVTTVIWAVEHDDPAFAGEGRAALARVLRTQEPPGSVR